MGILTLSVLIYYALVPTFITVVVFCILIKKFSEPYPTLVRTKKEKQYFNPVTNKYEDFPSIQDESQINLSVVIPAYDEQERLPQMLDECLEFLESRANDNSNFKYEVIIVNDGSRDDTSKVALKYVTKYKVDKVRLLELETNRGKGGAIHMGILSARGAAILFADADGATKFADLLKLESALMMLLKYDYLSSPDKISDMEAIVCGSRAHLEKEAAATRSFFRTILMHGFHFLVWLFAVRSIRDTQCGFKLLTRKAAKLCFQSLHIKRWAFDVELLYIAERYNIPIAEVAVRWTEIEGSKLVPFWSWLQMGRDLFLIWFRYRIGAWKIAQRERT